MARASQIRIGVLPPGSNFVPSLASDILAALKFGLAESRIDAELLVGFAGYNSDLTLVLPKVQEMLFAQQASCIIAPFNVALLEKLAPHFDGQRVPLIALSLEEDPYFETAQNSFVFVNSFHMWQAAWMCGYLAGQRFGPRGAFMAGLHESGYGLTFACQLGLEAANGVLVNTAVTHRNSSTDDPEPAIAYIINDKPDFIWAGYSGKEAVSFLTAYEASGYKQQIPLIGLPPLVDGHVRQSAGGAANGVHFVVPGPPAATIDMEAKSLVQALGRTPHPYALLAYESAHLLANASKLSAGAVADGLPENLRQAAYGGPRGLTRFEDGKESKLVFCICRVADGTDTVEIIDAPPLLYEQQMLARKKLEKQGWVNPYLCA